MRNLTIKRNKSFVACLGKMKIYIEDPESNDLVINNTNCRKLGDLKNGEEKTFSISCDEARIYVIADTLSKNFCNEFYCIPAGYEDVYLSGQNRYNPANGNAFRFDGEASEEMIAHRKKGFKTGLVILIVAAIVGFAVGFLTSYEKVEPEVFSADGMSITLTNEFDHEDGEGVFNLCVASDEAVVMAAKLDVSAEDSITLDEYADLISKSDAIDTLITPVTAKDGILYCEYIAGENDGYFYTAFYESGDALWCIQFASLDGFDETTRETFEAWASQVTFS